ncbi:hypothetical protein JJV70_18350 [Streptomyces sp. JJ66]|uniref:DUF2567 domain-containing protein n=1 Tax=Streptomyces sp. JJ66 TaxID=2803843 RepID=UPI001C57D7F3|nr:DUF2567 domain-containing protein [Streptomyces sp. JJ66]MBW1604030.1 hypothetical protein [Streptomyces sp. JJ66]
MTAPTPPTPQSGRPSPSQGSRPYDPWAEPSAQAGGPGPGDGIPGAPAAVDGGGVPDGETEQAVGVADAWAWLGTAAAVTLLGPVLGLLWWWLAPDVAYVSDGQQAFLRHNESEASFGVDGTFVLLAALLGIVCGALAFLVRRHGGVGVVLGLTSGGVLGSWLAAWLGGVLGPGADLTARALDAGRGGVFTGPLELSSMVLLLVWPLAAVATHLVALGTRGPRDADPQPPVHPNWGPAPDGPATHDPAPDGGPAPRG